MGISVHFFVLTWDTAATITFGLTRYICHDAGILANDIVRYPVPRACVARNMYVRAAGGNTLDGNTVLTLRLNGVDTALTVTLAAGVTSGNNVANRVSVAAGQDLSMKVDTTASTAGVLGQTAIVIELTVEDTVS